MPPLPRPSREPKRFPHLPRGRPVLFPDQVRPLGIACAQPGGRRMCLTAIIDWHGRRFVGRGPSGTMRAREVVACAREAFARRGAPGAVSSGRGGVFGSDECISPLAGPGIPQSMDGKARWADNVGTGRRFRAPKGEGPRSAEHSTPRGLEMEMAGFVGYYDNERIHRSLGYETPASWYCGGFLMAA